jgi:sugar lactone lactonase YvrE
MSRAVIFDDLAFGEGPRWHDGRLWISDIFAKRVVAIAPDGAAEVVCEVDNHPSGLGWLPDGRLLVVSMLDRAVLRLESDRLVVHADLSGLVTGNCNDMVVDGRGNAYVGSTGYEYLYRGQPVPMRRSTSLVLVSPDGTAVRQPGTLMFPNGAVVTADGRTLVVAQSHGGRLTAYDIEPSGALSNERAFAVLPRSCDNPDGICIDEEGAVWIADPVHHCCARVLEGGQVTDVIETGEWECIACALGGDDRRTLYLVLAPSREDQTAPQFTLGTPPATVRAGRVEAQRVDVPGAGWP